MSTRQRESPGGAHLLSDIVKFHHVVSSQNESNWHPNRHRVAYMCATQIRPNVLAPHRTAAASPRRAVAFARDIKNSKQVAEMFPIVVNRYPELLDEYETAGQQIDATNRGLTCAVHHGDGTFNALQRNTELTWLKGVVADDECRILTNDRCLSVGVDVPALDAVLFLQPRNSVVDVVQSVGRAPSEEPATGRR